MIRHDDPRWDWQLTEGVVEGTGHAPRLEERPSELPEERRPVHVTQPFLAPLAEFASLLEGVWERGILTNNGPLVQQLEQELERMLDVPRFVAVTNGTIALQMAIKALGLSGDVIVPSFTWVATVSAIKWEGCSPVFCDIDPTTLNIDVSSIEHHITDRTVAIMPVHVFGNPCDVEAIEALAHNYGLKVIFDAAHAIGSTWKGKSVLSWGDVSGVSLHATKVLSTGEGGGCVTTDQALWGKLERIRYFGHDERKEVIEDGFNGKMTEVHAALGIANLRYFGEVLADRKQKHAAYVSLLGDLATLQFQAKLQGAESNDSYFPVIFDSEETLLRVVGALADEQIYPRRYFYPTVNRLTSITNEQPTAVAEDMARRVLCLPHHFGLTDEEMERTCSVIRREVGG